jgi:hypothetical protein
MYKVETFSCMDVMLMIYDDSNDCPWNTNHLMTLLFFLNHRVFKEIQFSQKNSSLNLKFSTLNMLGDLHIYLSV